MTQEIEKIELTIYKDGKRTEEVVVKELTNEEAIKIIKSLDQIPYEED